MFTLDILQLSKFVSFRSIVNEVSNFLYNAHNVFIEGFRKSLNTFVSQRKYDGCYCTTVTNRSMK